MLSDRNFGQRLRRIPFSLRERREIYLFLRCSWSRTKVIPWVLWNSARHEKHLHFVSYANQRSCEENPHISLGEIKNDIKVNLEEFDKYWVSFEQLYVFELMLIEADARRYITEAIKCEQELTDIEK